MRLAQEVHYFKRAKLKKNYFAFYIQTALSLLNDERWGNKICNSNGNLFQE